VGDAAVLETLGLSKSFGALRVADHVDFRLDMLGSGRMAPARPR
jgi:hypothetical protein